MDSDCLVKLTKAGAKEHIVSAMTVHIPDLVKRETIDEVRGRDYQDAVIIEENINKGLIDVVIQHQNKIHSTMPVLKGESEVMSIYLKGGYDAVASDDRRFLRKLETANIPYLTAAACIIYLYQNKRCGKMAVMRLLEAVQHFISHDEYTIARFYMEGKK